MWKYIKNYENFYSVNELGEIKSNDRVVFNKGTNIENRIKGKILKQYKNNKGYLCVVLCKNGKARHHLVHRLVAEAFIANNNNLSLINHKDNNPLNNNVNNLEWCNHSYNINYCIKQNRQNLNTKACNEWRSSPKTYLWQPVIQYDLKMEEINRFESLTIATNWLIDNNITRNLKAKSNIGSCCQNKVKTAYGFIWRYLK